MSTVEQSNRTDRERENNMALRWDSKKQQFVESTGKQGRTMEREHNIVAAARKAAKNSNTFTVPVQMLTSKESGRIRPNITRAVVNGWAKKEGLRLVSFEYTSPNEATVTVSK